MWIAALFLWVMVGGGKVEAKTNQIPTVTASQVVINEEVEVTKLSPTPTVVVIEKWNGFNSVKVATRLAVSRGVSETTVVLLLLLPLLATLISVLHYIFGFSGYGIFIPSMMAVAFLATGLMGGVLLFAMILVVSLLSNMVLKRFRLHFWPSRAINLIFISLGTLGLTLGMSYFPIVGLNNISIFPILFMVLLSEEFVRTQLAKSRSEAKKLTLGTLVLAGVGAGIMSVKSVQELVLTYPELCLLLGLIVSFWVGNYSGIRWSEIKRFKKAIRKKK
jgi:hypothetical protein